MSYVINNSRGQQIVVLKDGVIDTTTALGLIGRNYVGYGTQQNENFIYLLENFANNTEPAKPITGQTWYDTGTNTLKVYDGAAWHPLGAAINTTTAPASPSMGAFWYKLPEKQLYVYDGTFWQFIGPESAGTAGVTRARGSVILDSGLNPKPVIELVVDDAITGIISNLTFTIDPNTAPAGFSNIVPGINLRSGYVVNGNITGISGSSTRLETPRAINGVNFDGTSDVVIKASTTNRLVKGTYLTGSDFDGSSQQTWAVDASSNNIIGKVVVRDSSGDFSAGTITANFEGTLNGNVNSSLGVSTFDVVQANEYRGASFGGNAFSASRLSPGRTINGVLFDGTDDILIPTAAENLTGTALNSNVVRSNLQKVGRLTDLSVNDFINVANSISISLDLGVPTMYFETGFAFKLKDSSIEGGYPELQFYRSDQANGLGGDSTCTLAPSNDQIWNIGLPSKKFGKIFSNLFVGTATSAEYADLAENYLPDAQYEPGTVLIFGGENEVTISTNIMDTAVAGVVSTDPAYLMNSKLSNGVAVALIGRVPCRVIGPIKKGDVLVTGKIPGTAASIGPISPYIPAGAVIGKALEDYKDVETPGVIEIVVGR